jgi:hypothetical protein
VGTRIFHTRATVLQIIRILMKKKPKKKELKKTKEIKEKEQETSVDKPFDFGGLPDRNLKKNLGCG